MMVPVKDEGRVVGVVQLMSDRGAYSSKQLEVFEGLVSPMAAAVRNARLQQERRRLEAAEAAARAVAAEREQAARVLDAVGDGIFLLDTERVVRLWNKACELPQLPARGARPGRAARGTHPRWEGWPTRIWIAEDGAKARSSISSFSGSREAALALVRRPSAPRTASIYACRDVTSERRLEEEKTTSSRRSRTSCAPRCPPCTARPRRCSAKI